ncbi:MAG TPA: hypothetical protein VFT82_00690 [Candidatus Paceibacterota bacterium]|nr:hypothetical protein [Candidatus Paceibacterota bacterium]
MNTTHPTQLAADVAGYYEERRLLQVSINDAQDAVRAAENRLARFGADTARLINRRIASGETTGDRFMDELISRSFMEKERLGQFVAFNRKLVEGKGKLFLIVCRFEEQTVFSMTGQGDRFDTAEAAVLGVLSGENIGLPPRNDAAGGITLPFHCHVAWRLGTFDLASKEVIEGPYVARTFGHPSHQDVIAIAEGGTAHNRGNAWSFFDTEISTENIVQKSHCYVEEKALAAVSDKLKATKQLELM